MGSKVGEEDEVSYEVTDIVTRDQFVMELVDEPGGCRRRRMERGETIFYPQAELVVYWKNP